jgi:eukaryotic-like serine/threonine-protein kinase
MVGETISHYKIVEKLGQGGMGVVYKAEDLTLDRLVALKFLAPHLVSDEDSHRRFIREAKAAATLDHPNICTVHEIGEAEGRTFIAMAYVEGQSLEQLIAQGPFQFDEAVELALQVAGALAAAHDKGIIHRDIKPANILVAERSAGKDRQAKLVDFGLAQFAGGSKITKLESTIGTVAYMSPEQTSGKDVDHRTDIWALGVVLYRMVTGQIPFKGHYDAAILYSILNEEPEPLTAVRSEVSPELERIVNKALAKNPAERYQRMDKLMADLRAQKRGEQGPLPSFAGVTAPREVHKPGAITKTRPVTTPVPPAWRTNRVWIPLAFLALVLVCAWVFFRGTDADQAPAVINVLAKSAPITAFRGNESTPSFSPDGNQIAFSWNGESKDNPDIYVTLVGPGQPVRVTTDARPDICPSWSRDGTRIAFLRQLSDNEVSLIVMPALGGRERALLNLKISYILGASKPVWSADSKWLIVSAAISEQSPQALARISVESGELTWITQSDSSSGLNDIMPALSPNGRLLAFSKVGGGFITAGFVLPVSDLLVPSGEARPLQQGAVSSLMPEWLDDDQLLVATGGVQSALWKISVSGNRPVQSLVVPGVDVVEPVVHTGSHRLAYVSKTHDTNIWTISLSGESRVGAGASQIISSTQSDVNPQMSPDGKRIAYSSNRSGTYEVWVWAPGAADYQLTTQGAGTTGSPRWSPSGSEIAFDSNLGGRSNVYVVNSEGGEPRKLTDGKGASIVPCWSKDGASIFFGSNRSGSFQIWRMNADGGNPVMVTKNGGFAALLSPDGDFIYYAKSPALASDVWRVPIDGGEESKVVDGVYRYSFAPTHEGLYYVTAPGFQKGSSIRFLEFASGKTTDVYALSEPAALGLGFSPDFHKLFFAQADREDSDIMLVEDVH